MTLEDLIAGIESEWEPDTGFFWSIRQGAFDGDAFERVLAKFQALPDVSSQPIPSRLVSVVWYAPLFMRWQVDRVREERGDASAYEAAVNSVTNEVERILGVP